METHPPGADPCTLVLVTADPPFVGHGWAAAPQGDLLELTIDDAPGTLVPGVRLVLEFEPGTPRPRTMASIEQVAGEKVMVRLLPTLPPDKREYPRVEGALNLRYRVRPTGHEDVRAWRDGEDVEGPELRPDPFMNISVTGLNFEDVLSCERGDAVLCAFKIPGEREEWRAVGTVVRVQPIPIDERDDTISATHRIAVHFSWTQDGAYDALRRLTIRLQEAWLGGDPAPEP